MILIITSKKVNVTIEKYYTFEIFMGFAAMQNPSIFLVNSNLLNDHRSYKKNWPNKVQEVFPSENLDAIEVLLEPLLNILVQKGDVVLKDKKALDKLKVSPKMKLIIEMIKDLWNMKTLKHWKTMLSPYPTWSEEEITTSEKVVKLLEKHNKYQLSLEHRKIVEDAKELILVPSVYLGTQLGFNYVNSTLVVIVGIKNNLGKDFVGENILISKEIFVKSMAALGEINRISIMQELVKYKGSIESIQLAKQLSVTPATISHHLKVLRQAGLVSRSKSGREVYYVPERARLEQTILFLKSLIEEE